MAPTDTPRPLRVLVCGSRDWPLAWACFTCGAADGLLCQRRGRLWQHEARVKAAEAPIAARLSALPAGALIIHGAARGADSIAATCARRLGFTVKAYPVTAEEWGRFGKRAGHLRNAKMLREERPDLVLAFNLGTAGTEDMMALARAAGVEVIEVRP